MLRRIVRELFDAGAVAVEWRLLLRVRDEGLCAARSAEVVLLIFYQRETLLSCFLAGSVGAMVSEVRLASMLFRCGDW